MFRIEKMISVNVIKKKACFVSRDHKGIGEAYFIIHSIESLIYYNF